MPQRKSRKAGGIPLLIRPLTIDAQPLFEFSLMAIHQVVFENNANVMELQQGAMIIVDTLVQVLSSRKKDYAKSREYAAWLLGYIASGNPDNQDLIFKAGALQELARLMASSLSSTKSKHASVWALGKIADGNLDVKDAIGGDSGAIVESIIPLLSRDSVESDIRKDAIWTLGTLACNHQGNRSSIGGIEGAIERIVRHLCVDNAETRENACIALGNMAEDRPSNQAAVRELPFIVKLLADEPKKVMVGALFAVICLCKNSLENREIVLKEDGLRFLQILSTANIIAEVNDTAMAAVQILRSVSSNSSSTSNSGGSDVGRPENSEGSCSSSNSGGSDGIFKHHYLLENLLKLRMKAIIERVQSAALMSDEGDDVVQVNTVLRIIDSSTASPTKSSIWRRISISACTPTTKWLPRLMIVATKITLQLIQVALKQATLFLR